MPKSITEKQKKNLKKKYIDLLTKSWKEDKTYVGESQAAKAIGLTRQTIWNWKNEDEEFRQLIEDHKEIKKDILESSMWKNAIENGNPVMGIWLSKTQMKERGYEEVSRQQIEHVKPTFILHKPEDKHIENAEILEIGESDESED